MLHLFFFFCFLTPNQQAKELKDPDARVNQDRLASRPLTVHVVVALCDNKYQEIVPVPQQLGNGQDPKNNLYWGALYGVKTFFTKKAGWRLLETLKMPDPKKPGILERIILFKEIAGAEVYLIADAWDGREIKAAIQHFLHYCGGHSVQHIGVFKNEKNTQVSFGGASHLLAFVGHNGLMDFRMDPPDPKNDAPARGAIVLACSSKPHFQNHLQKVGAKPLVLTTNFMAPEAYTLDAAVGAWFSGKTGAAVREAAANAYHSYQKCGLQGARLLFAGAN